MRRKDLGARLGSWRRRHLERVDTEAQWCDIEHDLGANDDMGTIGMIFFCSVSRQATMILCAVLISPMPKV